MFTVIFRQHGSDRHYPCTCGSDASILFEALARMGGRVEVWQGATLKAVRDYTFTN